MPAFQTYIDASKGVWGAVWKRMYDNGLLFSDGSTPVSIYGVRPRSELPDLGDEGAERGYVWMRPDPWNTMISSIGSSFQPRYNVSASDGNGNATNYTKSEGVQYLELRMEIRWLCLDEVDSGVIAGQLTTLFPKEGRLMSGPAGEGPFYVMRAFAPRTSPLQSTEVGGIVIVEAVDVCVAGDETIVPAIINIDRQQSTQ